MTGWSVCPVCRAVVWRDVLSRTFGHAPGCPNSKYMVQTPTSTPLSGKRRDLASQCGVFAKRPGKAVQTPYSLDSRGDCRPSYERGTGNFTISQAPRFPLDKKPPGADGDYNPGFAGSLDQSTAPTRKPASPAFKDKATKNDSEHKSKWHVPDTVGPATYLKHSSWLEGPEMGKTFGCSGSALRSKATRDVYGPGGISNLGLVNSPKNVNCYVTHDHEKEWNRKTTSSKLKWCSKGRTVGKADRWKGSVFQASGTPGPGEYHGLLSKPYSSLNTKIIFRDPDAMADRPYTGPN